MIESPPVDAPSATARGRGGLARAVAGALAAALAATLACAPIAPRVAVPVASLAPSPQSSVRAPGPAVVAGSWDGRYAGRRYRRSGSIRLELAPAGAGMVRGRVWLGGVPRTRHSGTFALTPAERRAATTDEVAVDSGRVRGSELVLWLAPYVDVGCECGIILTLRAAVRGDTLVGGLRAETGSLMAGDRGRWLAVRRAR